eukprot:scaffold23264_cov57-Phaeocystis_antarctica.AAC.1
MHIGLQPPEVGLQPPGRGVAASAGQGAPLGLEERGHPLEGAAAPQLLFGQLRGVAREAQPAVGVAAAHGGEPVATRAQELEQTGEARRVDCRRRGA